MIEVKGEWGEVYIRERERERERDIGKISITYSLHFNFVNFFGKKMNGYYKQKRFSPLKIYKMQPKKETTKNPSLIFSGVP